MKYNKYNLPKYQKSGKVEPVSLNDYGKNKQSVYFDGTNHYIFVKSNGKYVRKQVDKSGNVIPNSELTYDNDSDFMNDIGTMEYLQTGSDKKPNKSFNNTIKDLGNKISNLFKDKNPYREGTYGDVIELNKELKSKIKDERQKNVATRRVGNQMKRYYDLQKQLKKSENKRPTIGARNKNKVKKAFDQANLEQELGPLKTEIKVNNLSKKGKVGSEKRSGKKQRLQNALNLKKMYSEQEETYAPLEERVRQDEKTKRRNKKLSDKDYKKMNNLLRRYNKIVEKYDDSNLEYTPDMSTEVLETNKNTLDGMLNSKMKGGYMSTYKDGGNVPTNPSLYSKVKSEAKSKFKTWPSAYGSAWLVKTYKSRGGGYKKAQKGGELTKYQGRGNQTIPTYTDLIPGSELLGEDIAPYAMTDAQGNIVHPVDVNSFTIPEENTKTVKPVTSKSNISEEFSYDPTKLNVYGNRLQKRGVYTPAMFNFAKFVADNPLVQKEILPEFKSTYRERNINLNPTYNQRNLANTQIKRNSRGWGQMMGNLQTLNANTQANIASSLRQQQLDNMQRRDQFEDKLQQYELLKANEKRRVENENIQHRASHEQLLADAMTELGKADIESGKLHGSEQRDFIRLTNYVNNISPDYKVIMDKNGMTRIIHRKTGKESSLRAIQEIRNAQIKAQQAAEKKSNKSSSESKVTVKRKGGNIIMDLLKDKPKKLRRRL